ncbi:MAG TPA: hypothetical protein VGW38_24890, partial [Chloroflexota bacterium]|nr:hypothetical protein [Chloroflexota bacterium]
MTEETEKEIRWEGKMLGRTERLADLAPERLQDVVRVALGEPAALVGEWDAVPLRGGSGAGALTGDSGLYALTGTAHVGAAERPW